MWGRSHTHLTWPALFPLPNFSPQTSQFFLISIVDLIYFWNTNNCPFLKTKQNTINVCFAWVRFQTRSICQDWWIGSLFKLTAVTGDLLLPGAAECTATPQTCWASCKAKFRVSVHCGMCQGQPVAAGGSDSPGRASCCPSHLCFVPDNCPPSFNHDNLSQSQKWANHGASMYLPTTVLELEHRGTVTSLWFG